MSDETTPPASVSAALGNAGSLPEIRWDGRTYAVALPCPAVLSKAERMVPRLAREYLNELRDVLDPADWAKDDEMLRLAVAGGKWAYGHPLFRAVSEGPDGDALVLWACIALKHPAVTMADVRRMQVEAADDCDLALLEVTPLFFVAGSMSARASPERRRALAARTEAEVRAGLAKRSTPV